MDDPEHALPVAGESEPEPSSSPRPAPPLERVSVGNLPDPAAADTIAAGPAIRHTARPAIRFVAEPGSALPPTRAPAPTLFPAYVTPSPSRSRRAVLLMMLFAAAALFVWAAAAFEGLIGESGPREIVRTQIDDLGNGRLRAAYDLFSPHYRQEVPFAEWRELVVTHWRIFRTRELRFGDNEESNGHAVLEMHLVAESGDRYVARFTLIRTQGHWWIDDLRWAPEPDERNRVTT